MLLLPLPGGGCFVCFGWSLVVKHSTRGISLGNTVTDSSQACQGTTLAICAQFLQVTVNCIS